MRLGIDASNLRAGGGITHLVEFLKAADPLAEGFTEILVWGGRETLRRLDERLWLIKSEQNLLNKSLLFRIFWQVFLLSGLAKGSKCDVLFVPGGTFTGNFQPVVAMSRNMLPFESKELLRYGASPICFRLFLLRYLQSMTFRRVRGIIFLTSYAKQKVLGLLGPIKGVVNIIPHGLGTSSFLPPREQATIEKYSQERPFRLIYVSIVDVYKHQWKVAEAVFILRKSGMPVMLDLIGPAYPPALKRLQQTLHHVDPKGEFIRYIGELPYNGLPTRYAEADLCLFASSCENMPNILLEGMASGLPIACSDRGPMPEVLGDTGVYFDPEDPLDIARAIKEMIDSPQLRASKSKGSFERARSYSWARCAKETFKFLASMAEQSKG